MLSVVALSAVFALEVAAQTTISRIVPAFPTSRDVITAYISETALCHVDVRTIVTGFAIRTDVVLSNCFGGPPGFNIAYDAPFGPLPAGTYTYEVYLSERGDGFPPPVLVAQRTIVVTAAPAGADIPTLGRVELSFLATALIFAAFFTMRRFN